MKEFTLSLSLSLSLFSCTDLKKILELDPSNDQARKGIRRLEPLAAEKREKMKEEAISKFWFFVVAYSFTEDQNVVIICFWFDFID